LRGSFERVPAVSISDCSELLAGTDRARNLFRRSCPLSTIWRNEFRALKQSEMSMVLQEVDFQR
jgi:hypothetical protein